MKRLGLLGSCLMAVSLLGLSVLGTAAEGDCAEAKGKRTRPVQQRVWGHQREVLQRAMDTFKAKHPQEYERLEQLKETDREAYYKELGAYIPAGCVTSAKVLWLDRECFRLAHQFHQARTEEEREALKAELTAKVEESTEVMLADFRKRLERMRQQLETKTRNRDELVQRRVNMFLKRQRRGGHR